MGLLNKLMDVVSVELEASTVSETKATMGTDWSLGKAGRDLDHMAKTAAPLAADTFWTKLTMLPHLPGAPGVRIDVASLGEPLFEAGSIEGRGMGFAGVSREGARRATGRETPAGAIQ